MKLLLIFAKNLQLPLDQKIKYTKYGILNLLFEEKVESTIVDPVFVQNT